MNLAQRKDVFDKIEAFENIDFQSLYAEKYKDQDSLDQIVVSDYTAPEFLFTAKTAVNKLKVRLESDNWQVLPNTPNLGEYGNLQNGLGGLVSNITNNLKNFNNTAAVKFIKTLVYYELVNGFWNIHEQIEHDKHNDSITKLEERSGLISAHIEEKQKTLNELIEQVNKMKGELKALTEQKTKEFETIKTNQNQSNNLLTAIQALKNQADTTYKSIDGVNAQCGELIKKLQNSQDQIKKQQKDTQDKNDTAKSLIQTIDEELKKSQKDVNEIVEEVTKRRDEITRMMGYVADGTLGHSFNHRKQELNKEVTKWFWATGIYLLVLFLWILILFICPFLSRDTGNVWANILIAAIKTSPLAYIFWFSISRLTKVIALREEYAYRETIALTINSYLAQLEEQEKDKRTELLLQTVEKLYTKPKISKDDNNILMATTKELAGILKELTEVLKTIKN